VALSPQKKYATQDEFSYFLKNQGFLAVHLWKYKEIPYILWVT